ncbi:MAG: hypothetical protein JNL97_03615 [Verrucomicrobiales bacterium]|nr:hypothetical protein [Verrucomicrobiales bacterium]
MNAAFATPAGLFSWGGVQVIHPANDGTVTVAGDFQDDSDYERPAIVRLFGQDERLLLDPGFVGGRFRVSLWTRPGGIYVIEARGGDTGTGWLELGRISGDATVRTFTEPAAGAGSRIFRVRIEP